MRTAVRVGVLAVLGGLLAGTDVAGHGFGGGFHAGGGGGFHASYGGGYRAPAYHPGFAGEHPNWGGGFRNEGFRNEGFRNDSFFRNEPSRSENLYRGNVAGNRFGNELNLGNRANLTTDHGLSAIGNHAFAGNTYNAIGHHTFAVGNNTLVNRGNTVRGSFNRMFNNDTINVNRSVNNFGTVNAGRFNTYRNYPFGAGWYGGHAGAWRPNAWYRGAAWGYGRGYYAGRNWGPWGWGGYAPATWGYGAFCGYAGWGGWPGLLATGYVSGLAANAWAGPGPAYVAPAWPDLTGYLGWSPSVAPVVYDYGTTIVYNGDQVEQNGTPVANAAGYYREAADLAAAKLPAPAEDDWMPLGVFAMVQGRDDTPAAVFQLAVGRNGELKGNYHNPLTDTTMPVRGSVDPKTQRAAWTVGDNKETVYDTGLGNLNRDQAPLLVHFGKDRTLQWLLVRMTAGDVTGAAADAGPRAAAADATAAKVTVVVPANARVWFNGSPTAQTGAERVFDTPGLTPGHSYHYDIRARWTDDAGTPVERTRRVNFRPGDSVRVDFRGPG